MTAEDHAAFVLTAHLNHEEKHTMTNHVEDKKHAVLGPSSHSRWSVCPGSVALCSTVPNKSSKYAAWGTGAHHIAELCLAPLAAGTGPAQNAEEHVGTALSIEGFDIKVDMEMADCVNEYISYLLTFIDPEHGDTLKIEQAVPIAWMTGEEDAEGTADAVGLTQNGKRLVVADLKGGQGVKVDISTEHGPNGQFMMYAAGALRKFGMVWDEIEEVEIVVIQPRKQHVDSLVLSVDAVRDFAEGVSVAAALTQLPDAELVPGEKQCRFCDARGFCPALAANALEAVTEIPPSAFQNLDAPTTAKKVSATIDTTFDEKTGEALSQAARAIPLIEIWITGVRAEIERRLFDNTPVPGFKLVEGKKGNRAWKDEDDALTELTRSGRLKVAEATTAKVISPTAAEKLLKDRPKIWAKIAPLIGQSDGKPSVAPESDPRPPYQIVTDAASFPLLADETPNSPPVAATEKRWSILD